MWTPRSLVIPETGGADKVWYLWTHNRTKCTNHIAVEMPETVKRLPATTQEGASG
jgi:hypothetical protein